MSALSSLYEFLTDKNAVATNPVKGVKRPKVDSYEGKTPAIADKEARQLMNLPNDKSLKGLRDRAMLATLLYHGLRREELCQLKGHSLAPRGASLASPRQRQQDPLPAAPRRCSRASQ